MANRTIALVVAAGRGERLGGAVPKQYRPLAGRPVLRYALETFTRHAAIGAVRVVIHPDDRKQYETAAAGLRLLPPAPGGDTRQESVRRGLDSLADLRPERVLIHDGARPLIDAGTIDRTLAALDHSAGAIAAVPLVDSLKRAAETPSPTIAGSMNRAGLWRAQTPQAFRYAEILAAHHAARDRTFTDDAALAEAAGLEVALVLGSEDNFKITTAEDLARAERLLATQPVEYRTGTGFDVHAFGPGESVRICGVEIPHRAGLLGHSDADVGLHALTDAILGAIAAPDIGHHFPPTDPRWQGADSALFLQHAVGLVAQARGRLVHVDVTIICERPKIAPHREHMVHRLAALLGVDPGRVSVKGKTTEGLGFTGRAEGIAAQATATVTLPAGQT